MTPSLGYALGFPIALTLIVISILVAIGGLVYAFRAGDDDIEGLGCGTFIIGTLVAVVLSIGTGIAMWPWEKEYHYWKTTSGTLVQIDSRMIPSGKAMEQRFVVTFDNGQQRACDDTRCASLRVGDRLTLKCKRHYQWGASPGYDCNWIRYTPKPR